MWQRYVNLDTYLANWPNDVGLLLNKIPGLGIAHFSGLSNPLWFLSWETRI